MCLFKLFLSIFLVLSHKFLFLFQLHPLSRMLTATSRLFPDAIGKVPAFLANFYYAGVKISGFLSKFVDILIFYPFLRIMDTKFYIAVNGNQAGPFSFDQLASQNITPDTLVWFAGQPDWARASTIPQLQSLFSRPAQPYQQSGQGYQQQPYQQPYQQPAQPVYGQQQYGQPIYQQQNNAGMSAPRTNWMTWAIVATVAGVLFGGCLALIFGIIAINKASAANKAYAMGDVMTGDANNSSAKTWTIVSLCLDALGLLILIFYGGAIFAALGNM